MIDIVILGGSGNGLVTAQIIEDMQNAGGKVRVKGFLNDHLEAGSLIGDWPVLGKTKAWKTLPDTIQFVYALLSVGKMQERVCLLESLNIPDHRLASAIHPSATISRLASVGAGSVVASHVTCQPKAVIGRYNFIRAGANIGHDVETGDYTDVGPNATLCGYSRTGKGAFIGPNSVLKHQIHADEFSVLGAGSVALKDLPMESTWMGCPARRVR